MYRYRLNSGTLSPWRATGTPFFSVATQPNTTEITFQVYATDTVGNRTPVQEGTVSIIPTPPYELSEDEVAEAEEEVERSEPSDDPLSYTGLVESAQTEPLSAKAGGRRPGPSKCKATANEPHPSVTEFRKGFNRIAATSFVQCGPPDSSGKMITTLLRKLPNGSWDPVTNGGADDFEIVLPYERDFPGIEPPDCVPGTYVNRIFAFAYSYPDPNLEWEKFHFGHQSEPRKLTCKELFK